MPTTGKLWFLGLFLITACPPSLIFYPEFYLVMNAPLFVACATLLFLFVVFAGMMNVGVRMANGVPGDIEDSITEPRKLPKGVIATPLMAMSFLFIVSILAFITMLFN